MHQDDAVMIVRKLLAFYPEATLDPASVDAYVSVIQEWESVECMDRAVHGIIMAYQKFPTIAQLREAYLTEFKKKLDRESDERGLPEPLHRSPPPKEWFELMARLGVDVEKFESNTYGVKSIEGVSKSLIKSIDEVLGDKP